MERWDLRYLRWGNSRFGPSFDKLPREFPFGFTHWFGRVQTGPGIKLRDLIEGGEEHVKNVVSNEGGQMAGTKKIWGE